MNGRAPECEPAGAVNSTVRDESGDGRRHEPGTSTERMAETLTEHERVTLALVRAHRPFKDVAGALDEFGVATGAALAAISHRR